MSIPERLQQALADRYRLEREIGAGGMAMVYLAEDLKHKRRVAVKVLRPELAAVIGAERFLTEITTTANLQHPHILPLHDSGVADGTVFYVMPFVEGESLRDRLTREKQLPIGDAVRIATEVADALDYAHRHGVIHRDIKPENILLHDGRALVADFGIALAATSADSRMTETGMSLGTPHYMSPEQAMGERNLDARTDVYAVGCVLYEMLVGEPPFTGPTAQSIVAKVMTAEPEDVQTQRRTVPTHVADAVRVALAKLPADRFASAAALAAALRDAAFTSAATYPVRQRGRAGAASTSTAGPRRFPQWLGWAAAAACLAVAAVGWLRPSVKPVTTRQRVVLWEHALPFTGSPGVRRVATQAAIAPDGSLVVFVDSVGKSTQLFRKPRDEASATSIAGTEAALSPFFSPDGKWIGYLTQTGALRKVLVTGGASSTIADDASTIHVTAAWLHDGTIIYVGKDEKVRRVAAAGGASMRVDIPLLAEQVNFASISPLPDSRGILFSGCPGNCSVGSNVYGYVFDGDSAVLLAPDALGAWYAPGEQLLYTTRDGDLFAVGLDIGRMVRTGEAVPVSRDVAPNTLSLSASGAALYLMGSSRAVPSELVWVTRDGQAAAVDSSWYGQFQYPALSPDGENIAVSVIGSPTEIWVRRSDGARRKLTPDGAISWRPFWSRNGQSVLYVSDRATRGGKNDPAVFRIPVELRTEPELVHRDGFGIWEAEMSGDGHWLVYRLDDDANRSRIVARRLDGDTTTRELAIVGNANTVHVALSPDAKWLAYTAYAFGGGSGTVFVTAFPDMSTSRIVSSDNASEPRWSRDGRELFFKRDGFMTVVSVKADGELTLGTPRNLFPLDGYLYAVNRQQYDVTPDGQRLLMVRQRAAKSANSLVYAEGWLAELAARLKQP